MTDEKNTVIDLSFTQDPQWIAEREKMWLPMEEGLKEDFRRKDIQVIRHYCFTGEQIGDYKISDSGLVAYFPLQASEGWDYVYEKLVRKPDVFRQQLEQYIFNQSKTRSPEQELAYWDYFFGPTFEPIVRSRVPVGRAGKIVEVKLDPLKVLAEMLTGIAVWIDRGIYGDSPKWVFRKGYLYSLFAYVTGECFTATEPSSKEMKVGFQLIRLMKLACNFVPKNSVNDPERNREKFLSWFADCLNMGDGIPDCVKERWQKIKAGEEVE